MRKKPTFLPGKSPTTFPTDIPPHQKVVRATCNVGQRHRQGSHLVLTTLQGSYTYLTRFLVLILGAFTLLQ